MRCKTNDYLYEFSGKLSLSLTDANRTKQLGC